MTNPETHATDVHVGVRLRERRLALAMSQSALAEGLGITFQQIQKYENGANRVGASRLWQLCKKLGVEPGYFFEGLDDGPLSIEGRTPREIIIAGQQLLNIPEDVRKQVLGLIRVVADSHSISEGML